MSDTGQRSRALDWLTASCWVALIVLVSVRTVGEQHTPHWTIVALFGGLVVVAENLSLRFPTPITISPQVIFVMAAIVALNQHGEGTTLGATVVGACGGLLIDGFRSRRLTIVAFNLAQMGLAAGLASLCYVELTVLKVPIGYTFPLVVIVYLGVNAGLVIPAAVIRSGASVRSILVEVRQSQINDFIFGIAGLGLGLLYGHYRLAAVAVVVGTAIIAQSVFLAIVRVRQAYTRIDLLYRFTLRLERSQDERDAVMSILSELRSLLKAGTAELTVLGEGGWRRTALTGQTRRLIVTEGSGKPAETDAVAAASVLIASLSTDHPVRHEIAGRAGDDGMAVGMQSESGTLGTIVLGQPTDGAFGVEDLRLLEALASHAAVTLENSRLLGQLRYDSHHDHLTGLPNRTRFNELIADLPRPSAILLIDLDRFKEINDTLGHQHGDLLLTSVARRVSDEVGHRGIVARLGGDEFGILLPQTGSGDAAQVAVSLLSAIEQPFQIGELELEITGSIGVAVAQGAEDEGGLLLQRADVAMYSAKESHSGWELYSSERDHYSPRRLTLAGELRKAIDTGELEVHYQPKSELTTGRVCGVEALVRWRHPRYGIIGPDHFIPVAESAGLIRPLTSFVLTSAVKNQRELRVLGYDLDVAVNLSVRSVLDVNLPNQIAQVLSDYGVPSSSLTLEITEGSVMADPTRTIGILGRLAQLGVSISVDDFGTGYSSLSYLKRLPANEVKIDRSFVAGMLTNDSDRAIVRSTVDLARNLGLRAVAEGVEDKATWDALCDLGCDFAQGYYVSPPLPVADLRAWLLARQPATDPTV
jgi:diguanylate cyclase (GGDEF)-like protein